MKYLVQIIWLMTCIISMPTIAQTTINGRVVGTDNEPIPFANILVLNQVDSSLIQGGISDFDGLFSIPYKHEGSVYASVSYIGYMPSEIAISEQVRQIELGTITLEENEFALNEIVVKSRVPLFEQKIDRVVVNVQSSVTNAGNTALNVLNKSPNVVVNRATGQLSLQGKAGILVMINDKEVQMEAGDLINLLDGMPAANIKEIELITTPPARYDAQGMAGIINIKMLDDTSDGVKGRASVFGAISDRPKYGGTFNLNVNKGKFFVYANLSANVDHSDQYVNLNSKFDYPDKTLQSNMKSTRSTLTGLYSGDFGLGYKLRTGTEIGLRFNIYNRDFTMNSEAHTVNKNDTEQSNELVYSDEINYMIRSLYNAYINHDFSERIKLSADYDFVNVYRDNPTEYHTIRDKDTDEESEQLSKSQAETPLNIHVLKSDLEIDVNGNIKLESGLKYTYSGFENDVSLARFEKQIYVSREEYTQRYTMNENIYAGYVSMDWKLGAKLMIKGGVRYENYNIHMSSNTEGVLLDNSQGQFFPNAFFNYTVSEDKEINGSFAQRTQRPGFLQLAPYFYFFNSNTLFTGNPKLSPAQSSMFKLNYRYKRLNVGLEYTRTNDPIFTWQPVKDVDRQLLVIAPSQGIKSNIYALSLTVPWKITNNWESNYSLLSYHRNETTAIMNQPYKVESNNFNFSMNHSYQIINNWIIELNYMYNSKYMEGATEVAQTSSLDLGLMHKFKNGASLSFNINDVFQDGMQYVVNSVVPEHGMQYDFKWQAPSPVYRISLSIPLGNKKVKVHEHRSHGSADELNRL
ncbi:TonB-dependent receptor domain-containing protein [Carboxylicivirga sp. N1Y90]|uniref:TonB-dependent receptor domain-containing protein n=1 Tax=Carboxylicivirga fragile TaxID=3417571 RepID=UPI003D3528D4|nr:TonB-dependent receptor [Marinilabiliaceae bacterium N1Y90]